MTTIHCEVDADPAHVVDSTIAVVGYRNQGRSRALDLRGAEFVTGRVIGVSGGMYL